MRSILTACVVMSAMLSAVAAELDWNDVKEILRHHAALVAAIKEGPSEEMLMSVGRSLIAALLSAVSGSLCKRR